MKKRIIIIVSAVLIVCALVCCITKKQLVIEIVPEDSIPRDLIRTNVGISNYYINGKESVTEAEQKEIAIMCSNETVTAVRNKISETHSSSLGVALNGKAICFEGQKLSVYYYYSFIVCDDDSQKNIVKESKELGSTAVKVTFERKSIVLSAIFGN